MALFNYNLVKNLFHKLFLLIRFIYKSRVKIVKAENFYKLSKQKIQLEYDLRMCTFFTQEFPNNQFINLKSNSYSSKYEDLVAAHLLNFKKLGFFVEIGAGNGVTGSNTLLFERFFDWTGLLVEPAKIFHAQLFANRPQALISIDPIFDRSGVVIDFQETTIPTLSTFKEFLDKDKNSKNRKIQNSYRLLTISLNELFSSFKVPKDIDFLSIDTEGAEFMILNSFNFKDYRIKVICVEHNYTDNRNKIHKLLTENKFRRRFDQIFGINDFYVNEDYS